MKYATYLVMVASVLSCGCIAQNTDIKSPTFDQQLSRPPIDYSSGSIWQAGSSSLTDDFKARRKGDTLTILISETASASKEAKTDTNRGTSINAGIPALMGLKTNLIGTDTSKLINANVDSKYGGSGSTSRQERLNATITAKVIDVLPNGNLLIEGRRNVKVNNEDQIIVIEGTVRPSDINSDNVINSAYIADAKINYSGKGIISDRQSPGWLMNIIDKIWPF